MVIVQTPSFCKNLLPLRFPLPAAAIQLVTFSECLRRVHLPHRGRLLVGSPSKPSPRGRRRLSSGEFDEVERRKRSDLMPRKLYGNEINIFAADGRGTATVKVSRGLNSNAERDRIDCEFRISPGKMCFMHPGKNAV